MTIFLTSSHTLGWAGDLNPANGLADDLIAALPHPLHCVMISSFPDDKKITDRMAWEVRECFERAKSAFDKFEVLDRRTQPYAARMLAQANFIILCGGHVPTENRFFHDIHLRKALQKFDGVLLTISAGSMNAAERVYSSPEYDGESIDPHYPLHMQGLGLTHVNILPHYQQLRYAKVDGKRLVYDIVAGHSFEHPVYCLPDGSYFLITPERTELRGLAYKMHCGKVRRICQDDERKLLTPGGRLVAVK
ncbi:MAG: Type 1 glutamine amidotransferase-like domain-containing protein [Bacteroidaceae bacterium]|nr:Type 1 glutamine amidotransferase-like domain-containing protein [Bacteroidaceae bacterium]